MFNSDESRYMLQGNVLFHLEKDSHEWKIVIPKRLQDNLIDAIHVKLGHPGVYKTLNHLKRFYYWRGMTDQVNKAVTRCDLCQRV